MGKPRRKGKRAQTPGASCPQGKGRLQQVKKPVKSSVSKRKKKGPSPAGQKGVTRAAKQNEVYENHFQACMNKGPPDEVAGLRDNGGGDLSSTVPVKVEEWKGKVEGLGNEFKNDDHREIVFDIPRIGEIKEERMSDAEVTEVITEEELGDLIMDDDSEDKELTSSSCDSTNSDSDVSEGVEEGTVYDVLVGKASNAAMEVDEANEGTEAASVSRIFPGGIAQALPHVLKQLPKKELLNCRVVCQDWCDTVDFYLENRPVYYPYRHDVTKEKSLRSVWEADLISSGNLPVAQFPMATTLTDLGKDFEEWTSNLFTVFQTVASLSDFRKEFENSPRNPFVGRLVSLEPATFGAPEYWKEAKEMASKLGKHIWILTIYTPGDDTGKFYEFYKGIQKFLKMVPELKYLEIEQDRRYTSDISYEVRKRFFLDIVNRNPLPNLPQLQTLVLPRSLENVLKLVLLQRYGAQVGKIVSDFHEWNGNAALSLSELGIVHVPNFKSLSNKVFKPMQAANLQKLELHFSVQNCVPVNQLFKGLQKFTLLKAVSISFVPYCCLTATCKGCVECSKYLPATLTRNSTKAPPPMILPSVESFKLATISPYMTFQFLKSLPQLKYFHLKCLVGHLLGITENEEDIGMELKNLVNGKNTQLWKLLPSLKQVKVNDRMEYNRPLGMTMRSKNPWISCFDEVIPHLFCELEYADLLKLTLVCPAWKSAIENFTDHQRIKRKNFNCSSFKQAQLAKHYGLHHPKSIPCICFTTLEDIIYKLKEDAFGSESENDPFWFKRISLELDSDTRVYEFWNELEDRLKKFGQLVWFLSLKVSTKDELLLYKNLHRCFQSLPNLKSLEFCADLLEGTGEAATKLSQFIKENPLPTMEHLDTLCFSGNITLARKIVNALIVKYSDQLKRLDITPENWPINFGDLPKLVHLKLEIEVGYKELPTLFWSLKAPNLKHLDLRFSRSIDQQFLFKLLEPLKLHSLRLYFTQIRKRERSLTMTRTLYIDWKLLSASDIGEHAYQHHQVDKRIITFPSVEQLDVRLCHDEQSLQFLRCFPSLKYLRFVKTTDARPDDDVGVELMKCRNGREAAKQSKIWDMFPQLQEIQIIGNESTFVDRTGYFYVSNRSIAGEEYSEEEDSE